MIENSKKREAKRLIKLKNTITASFQAKQVGKGRERVKIKIIVLIIFYPSRNKEFKKKNVKKLKKKTPLWLFFQAKTGWERPRKSENKNYRSDHFLPNP